MSTPVGAERVPSWPRAHGRALGSSVSRAAAGLTETAEAIELAVRSDDGRLAVELRARRLGAGSADNRVPLAEAPGR